MGRGFGSAGDNPPSEGEQLKIPSFLISNAEFKSLGTSASQFGHRCSRSANVLGTHVRHWWQNCDVPYGSMNTTCFPSMSALRMHFNANRLHEESEIAFAS